MTYKQFYLKNTKYMKYAKIQEMKIISEKKNLNLKDVKEFMSLSGRPAFYVQSRMIELSAEYFNDPLKKEKYGSELNYIIEMFKKEMKLILISNEK